MIADLMREELTALAPYAIPHPANIRAKLDANESPHGLPPEVAEELAARLARTPLHRYPDGGAAELRAALAAHAGCAVTQLVPGNGSDELIALLMDTFARPRPGAARASVLWPVPSFVYYRIGALGRGQLPVEVPLAPDFSLDPVVLEEAIARTRPNLAFFALPNNPTGTLWPRELVLETARRHRDMLVVADEAYLAYSGASVLDALPEHPNLIILRTLSKIGLAALRVGYLIAHPAADVVAAVERIRPPYNIGTLAQTAATYLLGHHRDLLDGQAREVIAERDRVTAALTAAGVHVFPSRANFIMIRLPSATDVWHHLARGGVLVRNFDRPGPLAGCLRVTIGTRAENDLFLGAMRVT